jgi:hypothetical protein
MVRQAHHPEQSRRTNTNYQNTKFKTKISREEKLGAESGREIGVSGHQVAGYQGIS